VLSASVSVPKVLVADDSPVVLHLIVSMLSQAGIEVVTARDGMEALEKAFSESFRLVILDVTMPRLNGYQACRLLKNDPATRDLPVVILTSRDQAGDRFWGLETGADYFLTKDAEPTRILDLVRTILAGDPPPLYDQPRPAAPTSLDVLSRLNSMLDRKLYEATILSEIGRVARDLSQFDQTFTSVMALVGRVVDFTVGAMAFVEEDGVDIMLALQRPVAASVVEEARTRMVEELVRHRKGAPLAQIRARVIGQSAPQDGEETTLHAFRALPVMTGGRLTGMLALGGRAVARIAAESDGLLEKVANQAQIVADNARLFDRVHNLSIRDSLTGLFNHRHAMELLAAECQRAARFRSHVGVMMLDVDLFKRVNDSHGHPAGDCVLREVARRLRDGLRSVDALGRYGGEEFIAVLPQTSIEEARHIGERLRAAVAARPIRAGQHELTITISVGTASYPATGLESANDLVRSADQALYQAKQNGRNQVV
jgi:two-component system, cell cycle response regulator